ncbi:DUF6566 family protein [Xanthomonas maliensis]|uniref:DUF6566 family protein n=1 Tax=Xanthomonas maliensis TaxID=1321368 RepID=UPI00039FF047|nr:DUF6566 family protein [Xanthomonas maliensis]KAB7767086.1 hypothetical protein CKY51_12270 [Xanthomonas maliensis]
MSRQGRFETAIYRDSEIRVRAEQADVGAHWHVWVDVYVNGKTRLPRVAVPGPGWETCQEAISQGFRAGRQLVDTRTTRVLA